jgi:hypothetical protein
MSPRISAPSVNAGGVVGEVGRAVVDVGCERGVVGFGAVVVAAAEPPPELEHAAPSATSAQLAKIARPIRTQAEASPETLRNSVRYHAWFTGV